MQYILILTLIISSLLADDYNAKISYITVDIKTVLLKEMHGNKAVLLVWMTFAMYVYDIGTLKVVAL